MRRATALLSFGLFLLYLVVLPPHLVHHLFDADDEQPLCSHLALDHHAPELPGEVPALVPPTPAQPLAWTEGPTPPPRAAHRGASSRAPPAAPSA